MLSWLPTARHRRRPIGAPYPAPTVQAGRLPPHEVTLVDLLVPVCDRRCVALGSWLWEVDEPPEEAVAVLRGALWDPEPGAREHAARALDGIGSDVP